MTNRVHVCYRGVSSRDTSLQAGWLGRWLIEGDQGIIRDIVLNGTPVAWSWDRQAPANERDLNIAGLNVRVLREMADYIEGAKEPGISGRRNLNSLHMVMGAIESAETGRRVSLYRWEDPSAQTAE